MLGAQKVTVLTHHREHITKLKCITNSGSDRLAMGTKCSDQLKSQLARQDISWIVETQNYYNILYNTNIQC